MTYRKDQMKYKISCKCGHVNYLDKIVEEWNLSCRLFNYERGCTNLTVKVVNKKTGEYEL